MSELGKAEEIAEDLRQKIVDGSLQQGERLKSERDLADEYQASRMTARRAIEMLEGEGLVSRYPTRGTFVGGIRERILIDKGREIHDQAQLRSIKNSELLMSGSFLKDMERLGRKPHVQFLEQPALVPATDMIAPYLGVQPGTLVLKRYRLQSADGLPYRIIESYYPSDLFSEILSVDIGNQPLFSWLNEKHQLQVVHAQETLIARLATSQERLHLHISSTSPVVAIDRTVWTNTGRCVEWAHIIAVAALYQFTYEYDIADWETKKEAANAG